MLLEESSEKVEIRRTEIICIKFSCEMRYPPSILSIAGTSNLRTTIQEHLDSGWEAVDPGLDSLEGLFIRDRVGGPSEPHQAMLDKSETEHQSQDSPGIKHQVGCTDSKLADDGPRVEGSDMYSVSFRRHPRGEMVLDLR